MILTGQILVNKARELAYTNHAGQTRADRKTPYVVHPEDVEARFMLSPVHLNEGNISWQEAINERKLDHLLDEYWRGRALSLTHDVAEDCNVTLQYLSDQGLESIISELTLLTKWEGGIYLDYLLRLRNSENLLALQVKLCDMDSNLADLVNLPSKAARKGLETKYSLARYILTHP